MVFYRIGIIVLPTLEHSVPGIYLNVLLVIKIMTEYTKLLLVNLILIIQEDFLSKFP